MEDNMTDFDNQVNILGQFYSDYREEKDFKEFIEYHDIGLPLAYLSAEGLAIPSESGRNYILDTFELFLQTIGVTDTGFETLDDVLDASQELDQ